MSENDESIYRGAPMTPSIRWAGGKRWANDILIAFFEANPSSRFIEPFAGGMASSLAIKNEETIVNDINPHLINFYKQIKDGLSITMTMDLSQARYLKYRDRFNQKIIDGTINDKEAAQLFFYLNKTGFNGMCRFNRKGMYNVPMDKSKKKVNFEVDFAKFKRLFSKWEFTCQDFSLIEPRDDDFTFIDCPYDASFSDYSAEGFKWDDQVRTAEWAASLKGPVVATNLSTDRIIKLYKSLGFEMRFIKARRTISCKGDERKPVMEMVAYKNAKAPDIFIKKSHSTNDMGV